MKQRLAELEQREGIATSDKGAPGNAIKGPTQDDIAAAKDMSPSDRDTMIKQMVAGLAERLKKDGGDIEEWKRLVRSYTVLGDKQAAREALGDARRTFAEDAGALASLDDLANQLDL